MANLSVVINTLNEEVNLPKALSSVEQIADEVVVVDMKSTDDTKAIAKKAGCRVYDHKRTGYVEPARNFAISKATGDWILILDADERLPEGLIKKIKEILDNPDADYYRIPRKNIVFRKWIRHSRWWPDYNIRLFRKGYVKWSEIIHSVPETKGKGIDLDATESLAFVHFNYDSIEQYVNRLNRYTTMQANNLKKEGCVFNWKDIIKKPSQEFLSRYFQGRGYKDGLHGLALASLQSFSELVLYLKLWQFDKFERDNVSLDKVISEIRYTRLDENYWFADVLLRETGSIKQRIKRKLKL